jgi:aspartate aminotransferase-like enzyme
MTWGRRFLPDFGDVHPDVLLARSEQSLAPEAVEQLLALAQPRLRELFRTAEPVTVVPAPAGMLREIGLRATIEHRVLVLVAGSESAALADTAEALGAEVIRMVVPSGRTPEPEQLDRFLSSPPVDSVALVHSESSTGTLAPLQALASVVRARKELALFVDATGSLGAAPLETDAWGLDFVLGASHGPLGLPPAIAFAAASTRLLARTRGLSGRGVLLDFLTHQSAAAEGMMLTPFDSGLAVALERQLERIEREGLPDRWARHQAMAALVESWAAGRTDLAFVAAPGRRSPSVSCLQLTSPSSASSIAERLLRRGWEIEGGLGPGAEEVLRIGHMGEVGTGQLTDLLLALEEVLAGAEG